MLWCYTWRPEGILKLGTRPYILARLDCRLLGKMAASCTRLQTLFTRATTVSCIFRRCCSSKSPTDRLISNSEKFSGEEDKLFKDAGVQELLKQIIERNVNLDKIFKARREPLKLPTYKLLDDEELLEVKPFYYSTEEMKYLQLWLDWLLTRGGICWA